MVLTSIPAGPPGHDDHPESKTVTGAEGRHHRRHPSQPGCPVKHLRFVSNGARVVVAGPATMMPRDIEQMGSSLYKTGRCIMDADVVTMLRIQLERQKQNIFPSLREYAQHYCLNRKNIRLAKSDAIVMHPVR